MSSIKLKHSGGNSVSLNPPTSAPTSSDVAFKLPNADGTTGQVLKTDASGNLGWTSNNGMTLLSTTSLSSSGTVSANVSLTLTDYRYLYGELYGIARSGGGSVGDVALRFNGNSSSVYQYVMQRLDYNNSYSNVGVQDANGFYVNQTGVVGFDSGQNYAHFSLHLLNEGTRKTFEMTHCYQYTGGSGQKEGVLTTNGFINITAAITSLTIEHSDTDISAGTLKLYGVK